MKQVIFSVIEGLVDMKVLKPIHVARMKFFYKTHRWPNFEHPKDVNEKINWLKFYGDTSKWSVFADKYAVREYVSESGFDDILIPLIGKWDSVDEIDWDSLPDQFVMKCNNGSGDVIICKDKARLDIEATKQHFKKCIKEKLSIVSGEPHYASIKPCIVAEKLLDSSMQPCNSTSLVDYKIYVFDGVPKFIWCTYNRKGYYAEVATYDIDWNFHPEWSVWTKHYMMPRQELPKPRCFDYLMKVAGRLGAGLPLVRVDLYIVGDKVYFGEMTMTPQGGYMDYYTREFLDIMGEMVVLPNKKGERK